MAERRGRRAAAAEAPRPDVPGRGPLLVTGMPRTATSWVGKMLEASGRYVYVNEPLSPHHPPGRSPGVLRAEVVGAYQYVSEDNEAAWLPAFRDTMRLRYRPLAELGRNRSPYDLARMVKYLAGFTAGRLRGRRALLDDPYAVFAAPWLARRLGCQVVVTVRDPAAVVWSYRRLGWMPNLVELLAQPALVRDWLAPFRVEAEAAARRPDDLVGQVSLLWRMIYATVAAYRDQLAGLQVVRHEDLSRDPPAQFAALYDRLGLPFDRRARRAVEASSSGRDRHATHRWSPSLGGVSKTGARPLDSRAYVDAWRERLGPQEVARVRELTADAAARFGYGAEPA